MQSTTNHIIDRNRRNALKSTGPRTEHGKAASRRNATQHGLCANPAAGVVEDPRAFERLHEGLCIRFAPRDPLEEGLVHRLAVCLWRLQRAARIDSAIGTLQVRATVPADERVQGWVSEITQAFAAADWVEVTDPELLRQRAIRDPATRGRRWFRSERRFLSNADRYRDKVLMADGAAIEAMKRLIQELVDQLEYAPSFDPVQAQLLAWLLGESAERLVPPEDAEDQRANQYPDETRYRTPIDDLIGQARKRPKGEALPPALVTMIQARRTDLQTRSRMVPAPIDVEFEHQRRIAVLLPDASTLDRLMRYEGHAERGIIRALETLSKLRGVTIESIRATMTRPCYGEETLEVSGERTTWAGQ